MATQYKCADMMTYLDSMWEEEHMVGSAAYQGGAENTAQGLHKPAMQMYSCFEILYIWIK